MLLICSGMHLAVLNHLAIPADGRCLKYVYVLSKLWLRAHCSQSLQAKKLLIGNGFVMQLMASTRSC